MCMFRLERFGVITEPCGTPFMNRLVVGGVPMCIVYARLPVE